MKNYKVLITVSGLGSRLGNLTKYTNKSLIRVGKKPPISYIIDLYDIKTPIVITLGHYGDHIKQYLSIAHPERSFQFVEVDHYVGEKSSLLYSMSQAKDFLQCPFIFQASDTLLFEKIPEPTHNWIGGYPTNEGNKYRTFKVSGNKVVRLNEKGEIHFDYVYIGLSGIYDYKKFWESSDKLLENNQCVYSDCHAIMGMGKDFEYYEFNSWVDTGGVSELLNARKKVNDKFDILDKVDESIYFINNNVIKFFYNKEIVSKRLKRASILNGIVPIIKRKTENYYSYEYVDGDLFSRSVTVPKFKNFLSWCEKTIWQEKKLDSFSDLCINFYIEKTFKRLKKFHDESEVKDEPCYINGMHCRGAMDLIRAISADMLKDGKPCLFHGDLILDNIIETSDSFRLIDWRQDFSGNTDCGDMYYDIAKLNHNLVFNHDIVNKNFFDVKVKSNEVMCQIMQNTIHRDCQDVLYEYVINKNLCIEKLKILTGVIWLNMAPLHSYPLNIFLYFFGRYQLEKNIK